MKNAKTEARKMAAWLLNLPEAGMEVRLVSENLRFYAQKLETLEANYRRERLSIENEIERLAARGMVAAKNQWSESEISTAREQVA